jgi:hypothetical protein
VKVKYFSESGYTHLFDSIPKHTELYGSSPNSDWIPKEFGTRQFCKESRIDVTLPTLYPEQDDYVNIIQIYNVFKDVLTPKQASNPYLWSYLAQCEYWDYTSKRWAKPGMSVDSIKQRFFCYTEKGSRIGFLRNAISRLWWAGYLTYQEDKPGNPYELTNLLCSNSDIFLWILDHNFSMNRDVCIGILSAIKEINDDPALPNVGKSAKTGEYEWRGLCKYINRFGAVTLLDALTRDDIKKISVEYILEQRRDASRV